MSDIAEKAGLHINLSARHILTVTYTIISVYSSIAVVISDLSELSIISIILFISLVTGLPLCCVSQRFLQV